MEAMFDMPSRRIKSYEVTLDYAKKQLEKTQLNKLVSA